MKKYVAFEAGTGDSKEFDTTEEAEKWLSEIWQEGLSIEDVKGSFISEVVTTCNAFVVDSISNYKCNYRDAKCDGEGPCDKCESGGSDEWPYESGHDEVCKFEFNSVCG